MEPLNLGVLAALTPAHVEVVMYDDRMESIPYDEPTDLVAITVETYTARRSYEIADEFRARGVPVILGGIHPTFLPHEAAEHADSLYLGDAETQWAQVIDDVSHRQLKPIYRAPTGNVNPVPSRVATSTGARAICRSRWCSSVAGCRFACSFCAVTRYFDRQQFYRDVSKSSPRSNRSRGA